MKLSYQTKRALGIAGIIVGLALTLGAVLVISQHFYKRLDLTQDRRYTLSEGSRRVLAAVESPVTIHFYFSRTEKMVPVRIKDFARRVEDLLREYEMAANGKLIIKKVNVREQSDEEEAAEVAGIERQVLMNGAASFYMGLDIDCIDRSETLSQLSPEKEGVLEYQVTRAIQRVCRPAQKTVGILAGVPVLGPKNANPFKVSTQRRAWMFVKELKKDYTVKDVPEDTSEIPEDVDILIVVHPKDITPAAMYAIDQFVLRGGNLIAFVDPMSIFDARGRSMAAMGLPQLSQSSLPPLFKAWGIEFTAKKVSLDFRYTFRPPQGPQEGVMELDNGAMAKDDPMVSVLNKVLMPYVGTFSGDPAKGLQKTVLMRTSEKTWLFDSDKFRKGMTRAMTFPEDQAKSYDLAIKLTGKFQTAYPKGPPKSDTPPPAVPAPPQDPAKDKKSEPEKKAPAHRAKSEVPGAVVLVGDSDLLWDELWLERKQHPFTQKVMYLVARDNNNFLQNAVEQFAGGEDLVRIRSRAVSLPAFTVVTELRTQTEEAKHNELIRLIEARDRTKRRLAELSRAKQGQRVLFESPEEREEREKLKRELLDITQNLRELDKKLNRDINRLGATVMWANSAGPPLLVILLGLIVWFIRRAKPRKKS